MDEALTKNTNSLRHEPIEADVRAVWITAGVIVGVVLGACFLIIGLLKWFAMTEGGPPANQQAKIDRTLDEQTPLQQLRSREQLLLTQYEWVDPSTGVARIPVDRAVQIIIETGLPTSIPTSQIAPSTAAPAAPADAPTATESNQ